MKPGAACKMTNQTSATFPHDSWDLGGFRVWDLGFRV